MLLVELPTFWQTIRLALRLDPGIYTLVQSAQGGLTLAIWIVLLAGLSEAVGQSVVLLINRVRPPRFLLALGISILSHLIGYLLWSTVIWLAVWFVFGVRVEFVAALAVVGLAYAPQLFAFFEVTPYFGNVFGLLLTLWSMAAVVVAVHSGMGLAYWQAAVTGLLSWAVIQLWRRSLGSPIYALGRAIERRAAGARLDYSVDDAMQGKLHRRAYSQNWRRWAQAERAGAPASVPASAPASAPLPALEARSSELADLERAALERARTAHTPVERTPVERTPVERTPGERTGKGSPDA